MAQHDFHRQNPFKYERHTPMNHKPITTPLGMGLLLAAVIVALLVVLP